MKKLLTLTTALPLVAILSLSACKTSVELNPMAPIDSMSGKSAETEARLSTEAAEAIAQGKAEEAVKIYEELYSRKSGSTTVAVNYAQVLRKTGNAKRAVEILAPYVKSYGGEQRKKASALVLNEYAAAQIELGNMDDAEKILNRVLEDEKAKEYHADAYNLMGVVLDANGEHREAENMFRMAADGWKGNPTSVMNNLALCLASQGMFDESLDTLRKALVMAPDKQEIARNIQIVTELRDSVVAKAPVDIKKPKDKKKKKK